MAALIIWPAKVLSWCDFKFLVSIMFKFVATALPTKVDYSCF